MAWGARYTFTINVIFLVCSPCLAAELSWDLGLKPAVFGDSVYLSCKIQNNGSNCRENPKQWFGGKGNNYGSICLEKDCGNSPKYSIMDIEDDECKYILEIKSFSVDDIFCDYTCLYGTLVCRKTLNMTDDFRYEPNEYEVTSFTEKDIMNHIVSIKIPKIWPKPSCFAKLEGTNKTLWPTSDVVMKEMFYQAQLNFTIPPQEYTTRHGCQNFSLNVSCDGNHLYTAQAYICKDEEKQEKNNSILIYSIIGLVIGLMIALSALISCAYIFYKRLTPCKKSNSKHRTKQIIEDNGITKDEKNTNSEFIILPSLQYTSEENDGSAHNVSSNNSRVDTYNETRPFLVKVQDVIMVKK